jgi:hypothetical protein
MINVILIHPNDSSNMLRDPLSLTPSRTTVVPSQLQIVRPTRIIAAAMTARSLRPAAMLPAPEVGLAVAAVPVADVVDSDCVTMVEGTMVVEVVALTVVVVVKVEVALREPVAPSAPADDVTDSTLGAGADEVSITIVVQLVEKE